MKRLLALVAACAAAFAALPLLAVDLAFPMTGGNGDLASGDAWSPYSWSDIAGKRILFANGTTTYTMSTNCTFNAFCLSNSANATVTFDLSNGVTNTLTGSGGLRLDPTNYMKNQTRNNKTIFKGGVWDFSGVGGFTFNQGQSYGWKESLLLDGATWTNLTSFSGMNYGNQDNSIVLTNGASVTAADETRCHWAARVPVKSCKDAKSRRVFVKCTLLGGALDVPILTNFSQPFKAK